MVKIGLIGAGEFAQFLLNSYRANNVGIQLVGVYDRNLKAAEKLVSVYGQGTCYKSVKSLLNSPEIELILVLTPPNTHYKLGKKVLQSGRSVLLEKPIATKPSHARTLVRIANKRNLTIKSNFVLRYHPAGQLLKKVVRSNKYGQLLSIKTTADLAQYPNDHWYWKAKVSGGFFQNTFCHFLDINSFITDSIPTNFKTFSLKGVSYITSCFYGSVPSVLVANLRTKSADENVTTEYFFEKATVTTHDWLPSKITVHLQTGQKTSKRLPDKTKHYQLLLSNVMRELIDESQGNVGQRVMKIGDLSSAVEMAHKAENSLV